jgi:hypothetical protein
LDSTVVLYGKNNNNMAGYSIFEYDKDIYKNLDIREVTALSAVNIQVQSISQSLCSFKVIITPFLWHAKTLGKG